MLQLPVIKLYGRLANYLKTFDVPICQQQFLILVEGVFCNPVILEHLLSDANFLSDLVLEVCGTLGINKLNTSCITHK